MSTNSKMVPSIRDSGAGQCDMGVVFKCGPMALAMRASGRTIKRTERENSGMSTVTSSMESGRMIRLTDMVFTLM